MGRKHRTVNIFQDKTVAEYLMMDDRELIDTVLQNVNPKQSISLKYRGKDYQLRPRVNSLFEIEYKWVIKIKQTMQSTTLNAVKDILSGIYPIQTDEQFFNCSIFDVFAAFAWVVEEIQGIYEVEKEKLFSEPTSKQKAAGIEEFEQLDDVPVIDGLAGGNPLKWNEILELPYGQVMRKMLLNKIQNEYNERYQKQK